MTPLLADVEARLRAVSEARHRLASQAIALATAKRRLLTGVPERIVLAELTEDPSAPLAQEGKA